MRNILVCLLSMAAICSCGTSKSLPQDTSDMIDNGYTTESEESRTSNVKSMKMSDAQATQYSSMMEYIRDNVPGVQVLPGSDSKIIVRGLSSLHGTSDPLVVVDGTEMPDVNSVNPQDVYSVDVLKDDAASMYGVKGSAGVIVIKTKAAKAAEDLARQQRKEAKQARRN